MASFRKPKGVYNRNSLDWFYKNAVTVGGSRHGPFTFPPFKYYIWQFFNSDSRGIPLHVVGLSVLDDGLGLMAWSLEQGHTGSLERSAIGVRPDQGTPFALDLYVDTQTNAAEFFDSYINTNGVLGSYFGTGPFFSGGPMFVIPGQWSLKIVAQEGNVDQSVNLWGVPLTD